MIMHGNRFVPSCCLCGKECDQIRAGGGLRKIDKIHPVLRCQRSRDILVADNAVTDEGLHHVKSPSLAGDIVGLLLGQQTDILEDFDHIFVVGGHCPEKGRVVWAKFDISLS